MVSWGSGLTLGLAATDDEIADDVGDLVDENIAEAPDEEDRTGGVGGGVGGVEDFFKRSWASNSCLCL